MLNISHAKKAQDLATETNYRTILHEYTTLPTDINVTWAKKAYGLQSDVNLTFRHWNDQSFHAKVLQNLILICAHVCFQKQYRSDLNWMKGVGWEASKSLDVLQAKKAGELVSEVMFNTMTHKALLRVAIKQSLLNVINISPFFCKNEAKVFFFRSVSIFLVFSLVRELYHRNFQGFKSYLFKYFSIQVKVHTLKSEEI